ncbi:MAG: hypothetical protein FJY56_17345 [Betaproteobacteria bacterium]|nr:hypothetical protein [Betaproteobacteria bacterium]
MKRLLGIVAAMLAAHGACAQELANGAFLVAQQTLNDPNFRRSVILVTQGRDGGSLGVILNRPTETTLRAAFPQHKNLAALPQPLYAGGPLQPDGLLFLLRAAKRPPASVPVLRNVYLVSDADWVERALGEPKLLTAVRVYAGHAGWAPRQLRGEIEHQGWHLLPADEATLFEHDPAMLWPLLMKRAVLRTTQFKNINKIKYLYNIPWQSAKMFHVAS